MYVVNIPKEKGGRNLKVIAITGMPGSGKEEFVKVAREEGLSIVRMGDIVREEVIKRDLELTDENIGMIASDERKKHGYGIWAERTIPLVSGDVVLIDGIRGDVELEVFKRAFGEDVLIIGVHTSPKTRYKRIKERKRRDVTMDWHSFCKRDTRELEWGIGNAIALSDFMILNEGTLEKYRKEIRNLLRKLYRKG